MFRAGDEVRITTLGEVWKLACDEAGGSVICAGWPETACRIGYVELVKAATDEEREQMLRMAAASSPDSSRARLAAHQLAMLEAKKETDLVNVAHETRTGRLAP